MAICFSGCISHAQGGPVIGYADGRGLQFGWEAGVGAGAAQGNIGGSYRPAADRLTGMDAVHYFVLEPGALVGITVGAAHSIRTGGGAAAGLWMGGWMNLRDGDLLGTHCNDKEDGNPIFSLALGFRYLAGVGEVYLTPKLGWAECFDMNS
jgi:hypothetical protein